MKTVSGCCSCTWLMVLLFTTKLSRVSVNSFPIACISQPRAIIVSTRRHTTTLAATNANAQEETSSSESPQRPPNYFLLKSEPSDFSIQQLKQVTREEWDGVRNFAARNYLRSMQVGDVCWFYHSSCATPAIVGTCRIARGAAPDVTALDPQHAHYESKSTPENCRWDSVLVEFDSLYDTPVTLKELKHQAKSGCPILADMLLLKRSRLSVMPVTREEWDTVLELMERKQQGHDLLTT